MFVRTSVVLMVFRCCWGEVFDVDDAQWQVDRVDEAEVKLWYGPVAASDSS